MEGFGQLIIFSIVMLAGSYGAGSAPLFMPMSEEKLHLISVFGAGLLVGVAFAVIIPEGVLALIKAYTLKSSHHLQQRSHADGKYFMTFIWQFIIVSLYIANSHCSVEKE